MAMGELGSYWSRVTLKRRTRRSIMRASLAGTAAIGALSLLACNTSKQAGPQSTSSSSSGQGTPKPGGTLNVAIAANTLLDPHLLSSGVSVMSASLSRPFRFKSGVDPQVGMNAEIEPDLALSAESPDGVTWTVKLRPDAKFQDVAPVSGRTVDSEDLKATFVRATTYVKSPNRGSVGMINPDQIQTPSKDTIVFKLNYPYSPFPKILASTYAFILPREAVAGTYDPEKTLIGSGPFILDSNQPDVAFNFRKNPNWFERGRPYIDGIRVAIVPDTSQQVAQFSTGHLDELIVMSNDIDAVKAANRNVTILKLPTQGNPNAYFQLGDPASVFLDERVRKGISMSLDRDAIGKSLFGNQYERYVFAPLNQGKWSMKVDDLEQSLAQYYSYNLAEAKRLLSASGITSQEWKMAYVADGGVSGGTTDSRRGQVEAFKNMLEAAGLKTTLVPLNSQKDYIDAGKGYRQGYYPRDTIMQGASAQYTDVDEYMFSYFHSKSTSNQEHLSDPTLDAMIDKERSVLNEDERLKALRDIQKYIAGKMYVVPSVSSFSYTVLKPSVRNYTICSSTNRLFGETYPNVWLNT
jgi:peptide/nickel transport system substrate-binding protein